MRSDVARGHCRLALAARRAAGHAAVCIKQGENEGSSGHGREYPAGNVERVEIGTARECVGLSCRHLMDSLTDELAAHAATPG